jgi:Protein of unknown function (DUF3379)
MDCLEFRRETGADPRHLSAAAAAHRDACAACAESLRRNLALDEKILAALRVSVPEAMCSGATAAAPGSGESNGRRGGAAGGVVGFPRIEPRRWMALAASIVGGVVIGSLLWLGGPRASLAEDVVKHMSHEPEAMVATSQEADPAEVAAVLARAHVHLQPGVGTVSYANTCPFRGEKVPHLVVQTAAGPMTVMVLRDEKVTAPMEFDEGGYAGTIVPAGPGSIAVIGHAPTADLEQVARLVRDAIQWE